MNDYRKDADIFEKDVRWTIWKFLPIFLIIIVILASVGFVTKSLGLWGGTIVERKVFENSYQRSESLKSEIAVHEATIAEIKAQLLNPNLDANTRYNLEAQIRAANIRINTARDKQ